MNDGLEVEPKDALIASQQLAELAGVYDGVVGSLQTASGSDAEGMEGPEGSAALTRVRNLLWNYSADTQVNLYDTSNALLHYINAVCEDDDANAGNLEDDVQEYNDELASDEDDFEGEIADPLPTPDVDGDGPVYEVPEHEDPERPQE